MLNSTVSSKDNVSFFSYYAWKLKVSENLPQIFMKWTRLLRRVKRSVVTLEFGAETLTSPTRMEDKATTQKAIQTFSLQIQVTHPLNLSIRTENS